MRRDGFKLKEIRMKVFFYCKDGESMEKVAQIRCGCLISGSVVQVQAE